MTKVRIAILASGRGTGFEAIAENARSGKLAAEIVAVVTDKPDSPVADKAARLGIKLIAVKAPKKDEGRSVVERRKLHEQRILKELVPLDPRFLVMSGYMRIVTTTLLEPFQSDGGYARVVNIHPSLLPAFPGIDAYGQAFVHGAKVAGVTVHLVDQGMDQGPILAQEAFAIDGCASAEEVEKLGKKLEYKLYSETLAWALQEQFELEDRGGFRMVVCRKQKKGAK